MWHFSNRKSPAASGVGSGNSWKCAPTLREMLSGSLPVRNRGSAPVQDRSAGDLRTEPGGGLFRLRKGLRPAAAAFAGKSERYSANFHSLYFPWGSVNYKSFAGGRLPRGGRCSVLSPAPGGRSAVRSAAAEPLLRKTFLPEISSFLNWNSLQFAV